MKNYIVEKKMNNATDGYFLVVVEGEKHLNRTIIKSSIQFFTTQGGYDYNHPWVRAKENAEAIATGLNQLEFEKSNRAEPTRKLNIELLSEIRKEKGLETDSQSRWSFLVQSGLGADEATAKIFIEKGYATKEELYS